MQIIWWTGWWTGWVCGATQKILVTYCIFRMSWNSHIILFNQAHITSPPYLAVCHATHSRARSQHQKMHFIQELYSGKAGVLLRLFHECMPRVLSLERENKKNILKARGIKWRKRGSKAPLILSPFMCVSVKIKLVGEPVVSLLFPPTALAAFTSVQNHSFMFPQSVAHTHSLLTAQLHICAS